jgi:feruloyl esterase
LMEAQWCPGDFEGIAAEAPAASITVPDTDHHGWNVLANRHSGGRVILVGDKLPLIHRSVIAACDTIDGGTDGIIEDPRRCHFDPATLNCTSGQDPAACPSSDDACAVSSAAREQPSKRNSEPCNRGS